MDVMTDQGATMNQGVADIIERTVAGEVVHVACFECGYNGGGELVAQDRWMQDRPPGPYGKGDWFEVIDDPERAQHMFCPECDAEFPDALVEDDACERCHGDGEVARNDSADPQREVSAECPDCHGRGVRTPVAA